MREGWTETTLGSIAQVNPEKTPKWPDSHQIRYVDISTVNWCRPISDAITPQAFGSAPGRARRRIRAGDIVVSTVRPNLRAMSIVPPELDGEVASTGFAVLRAMPGIALPGFVWAVVSHEGFRDDMVRKATGSNYPAVRPADVASHAVALPPLAEQRRIADLMAVVDAALARAQESNAAITKALTEAEVALARGTFATSGEVSATSVGDLISGVRSGKRPDGDGSVPVFGSNGQVGTTGVPNSNPGVVVVGRVGANCGSVHLPSEAFWATDNTLLVTPRSDVDPAWLAHLLRGLRLNEHKSGSGQPLITQAIIRKQTVLLGDVEMRGAQTDLLAALSESNSAAARHVEALHVLRSNLLSVLLSGDHTIPSSYDELLEAMA